MRSNLACLLAGLAAIVSPGIALAQSPGMKALEGHSISVDYQEQVTNRRGESWTDVWRDRIYISTKGRIFHRFDRQSPRSDRNRNFETVGDEAGRGDDRRAKFVWTGQGISRQWTNQRGVVLRQTITVMPTGSGHSCHMTVTRSGNRGTVTPLGQTCRVVSGNILAGS